MSFEPANLRHVLTELLGDDSGIAAELRALFLASATGHVAAMSVATDADVWRTEALRLQGLAASFDVAPLMKLAAEAARSDIDAAVLDRIARALADCR